MKKQDVLELMKGFPNEVNLNDLFEKLIVQEKIRKGLTQIEKGRIVSHDKVVARFKKMFK